MSIHPSLRSSNTLVGERSVLTRIERIQRLAKEGKIEPEKRSPFGLPKVRTRYKVSGPKKAPKAEKAEDGKPAAGAAAGAAAKPAAAAAAAKPAAKPKK